jgi:hypothetical protein
MPKKGIIYMFDVSKENSYNLVKIGKTTHTDGSRIAQHVRTPYHGYEVPRQPHTYEPVYFSVFVDDVEKSDKFIKSILKHYQVGTLEIFIINYAIARELLLYISNGNIQHDDHFSDKKNVAHYDNHNFNKNPLKIKDKKRIISYEDALKSKNPLISKLAQLTKMLISKLDEKQLELLNIKRNTNKWNNSIINVDGYYFNITLSDSDKKKKINE